MLRGGGGGGGGGLAVPGAGGSGEEEPGWSPRVCMGGTPRPGGLRRREGEGGGRGGDSGVRWAGGFSRASPGSSLLSSTSPLFMPLPLGCQIWLTQSVVSLLRLAPGTKAECITSPPLPLHEEREGRRAGVGDKWPSLNFRSCLPSHSSGFSPPCRRSGGGCGELWGAGKQGLRGRSAAPILERSQGQGRRSGHVAVPQARWRLGGRAA